MAALRAVRRPCLVAPFADLGNSVGTLIATLGTHHRGHERPDKKPNDHSHLILPADSSA
ncbi:MAG: hypothetical protein ACXAC5_01010 [Promethearchaeota archaeon]